MVLFDGVVYFWFCGWRHVIFTQNVQEMAHFVSSVTGYTLSGNLWVSFTEYILTEYRVNRTVSGSSICRIWTPLTSRFHHLLPLTLPGSCHVTWPRDHERPRPLRVRRLCVCDHPIWHSRGVYINFVHLLICDWPDNSYLYLARIVQLSAWNLQLASSRVTNYRFSSINSVFAVAVN